MNKRDGRLHLRETTTRSGDGQITCVVSLPEPGWFCRIYFQTVSDKSTLIRWTHTLRPETLHALNGSLFSLAYGLAIALAPVRVNAISPGWTGTPLLETILGTSRTTMIEQMAQRLPVGQIGRPEDIAHAVLFLLENEFTTATISRVDGGHRLV